jgi:magnesium chelatase family protein
MHAQIHTIAFWGIEAIAVTVQTYIANGMLAMAIIGLADKAVAESPEGVRVVLASIRFALPPKRISVKLALADVLKEGAHFVLLIALGLMVTIGMVPRGWQLHANLARKGLCVPMLLSALTSLINKSCWIMRPKIGCERQWTRRFYRLAPIIKSCGFSA